MRGAATAPAPMSGIMPSPFRICSRRSNGLREMEFGPSQNERGHQQFRSSLPIRPVVHDFHAAADGQLGGIMKVFREWRISGDTDWLRRLWPKVSEPELLHPHLGSITQRVGGRTAPQHLRHRVLGAGRMCTSFYLGALKAATFMGAALGEDVAEYAGLLEAGLRGMQGELFNGEYFFHEVRWKVCEPRTPWRTRAGGSTARSGGLLQKEGPKYQYGKDVLRTAFWVLGWQWCAAWARCRRKASRQPSARRAQIQF